MTIELDYYKARNNRSIVSRELLLKIYDSIIGGYRLSKGFPLLLNVEGSYVRIDDLPKLATNNKFAVLRYVSQVHKQIIPRQINFKWSRQ